MMLVVREMSFVRNHVKLRLHNSGVGFGLVWWWMWVDVVVDVKRCGGWVLVIEIYLLSYAGGYAKIWNEM